MEGQVEALVEGQACDQLVVGPTSLSAAHLKLPCSTPRSLQTMPLFFLPALSLSA